MLTPLTVSPAGPVLTADAATAGMNDKVLDLKLTPDNLKAMHAGTFKYKGIGTGAYLSDVKERYGQSKDDYISRDYRAGKTYVRTAYTKNNNLSLEAHAASAVSNASIANMQVDRMQFNLYAKKILKQEVEKTLGQATAAKGSIQKDKTVLRQYGPYLVINYMKDPTTKKWLVSQVTLKKNIKTMHSVKAPGGIAIQDKVLDFRFSPTNIKKMKAGTYQLPGKVGLNTPMGDAKEALGDPKYDQIYRQQGRTDYIMVYGHNQELTLSTMAYGYTPNERLNNLPVGTLFMNAHNHDVSKTMIEKYTGAAIAAEGSIKTDMAIKRTYSPNFFAWYNRKDGTFKLSSATVHATADKNGHAVTTK